MRVFKRKRKDADGRSVPTRNWYLEFRDHGGAVHRFAAFTDKAASEALGRKIERLVALRAVGEAPDVELARFISDLPTRIRDLLGKAGVLGRARMAGARTIDLLLEEFSETLEARERTENYVRRIVGRAGKAFAGAGIRALSDVQGRRLERFLAMERDRGMSFRTSNHYLAACRAFTKWTMEEGFLGRDPLAGLKPLNARLDPRRERRALSFDDELPRLIRAAAEGAVYRGVTGPMRALVYRLAAETGLRVSELVALRVGDLELEGPRPALTLPARATKNRQEARLELRLETARELEPLTATKLPGAPLLGLPRSFKDKATRWLRFDLEAAGIPYKDDRDRVADFHALRASFVSGLVSSGANARVVQTMARHSSAELTLSIYSKLGRDDERHALKRLPALPSTSPTQEAAVAATGTDGEHAEDSGPRSGPSQDAKQCISTPQSAPRNPSQEGLRRIPRSGDGGGGGSRTPVPESASFERLRA